MLLVGPFLLCWAWLYGVSGRSPKRVSSLGALREGVAKAWPSLLSVAATWDFGEALDEEFVGKGANSILGPSVRGRNFDYKSGEDLYLGLKLTTVYVKGVQS